MGEKYQYRTEIWMTVTCKSGDRLASKQTRLLELFARIKEINFRLRLFIKNVKETTKRNQT